MKANHNFMYLIDLYGVDVSNKTKILKWKQITTTMSAMAKGVKMFPIRQRY